MHPAFKPVSKGVKPTRAAIRSAPSVARPWGLSASVQHRSPGAGRLPRPFDIIPFQTSSASRGGKDRAMSQHQMWFRSTLFDAEAGGPNYAKAPAGRQSADWLRDRLFSEGQAIEAVIPKDWGWCIMVQRKPYGLWIGCGRVEENPADAERSTGRSPATEVIWSCYWPPSARSWESCWAAVPRAAQMSSTGRC